MCDRANNRIQVFRKDGTFVKEFKVAAATLANGAVWDLVLSEDKDQRFIFIADGANGQVTTISRENGEMLGQWGRHGRQPGQFKWIHNIAMTQGQSLHRGGRIRPPRAEVQAGQLSRKIIEPALRGLDPRGAAAALSKRRTRICRCAFFRCPPRCSPQR